MSPPGGRKDSAAAAADQDPVRAFVELEHYNAVGLIQKVHRDGRASDSELVSPPDTPRTPKSSHFTLDETFGSRGSTPGGTPANSFTGLLSR